MLTKTSSQMLTHSKYWPFPTITRSGVEIVWHGKRREVTTWGWTKLWVLPPSTRTITRWSEIRPIKRSASGPKWPEREFKLIWAWSRFGLSGGPLFGVGSPVSILDHEGSSSSAIMRRTLEAHLRPRWYFSSQVKQRPRSRREEISSGVRCRSGGGGGRGGDGNSGGKGAARAGAGSNCGGGCRGIAREEESFSSWRLARPAACTNVSGWWAYISLRISGARPEMKHARRNVGGNPMIRFARVSNSDR